MHVYSFVHSLALYSMLDTLAYLYDCGKEKEEEVLQGGATPEARPLVRGIADIPIVDGVSIWSVGDDEHRYSNCQTHSEEERPSEEILQLPLIV